MTANVESPILVSQASSANTRWREPARRAGLFLLFLLCAGGVFVFGSNYYTIFPTKKNLNYEGGTTIFFLAAALLLRSQPRFRQYWQVAYAFFVAAAVILVTTLTVDFRDALFKQAGGFADPNQEVALGKVFEALITITSVMVLSRLAGERWPAGVRIVPAGEFESRQESFGGVGSAIIVAVLGVLAILASGSRNGAAPE